MNASAAIADLPLRQAGMRLVGMPAGRLAPRGLDVLTSPLEAKDLSARIRSKRAVQAKLGMYLLGLLGLRVPVSRGTCAISRRTVTNNAGYL